MGDNVNGEIKVEETENLKPSTSNEICFPIENKFSHIKNKHVRSQQYHKSKREKKKVSFILFRC